MARTNRRDVLADQDIQVVHCVNRCVRRAFLRRGAIHLSFDIRY